MVMRKLRTESVVDVAKQLRCLEEAKQFSSKHNSAQK